MNPQEVVTIGVAVILYCFVAIVVGMVAYKKVKDDGAFWLGLVWPGTVLVFGMIAAATWISSRISKMLGWS